MTGRLTGLRQVLCVPMTLRVAIWHTLRWASVARLSSVARHSTCPRQPGIYSARDVLNYN